MPVAAPLLVPTPTLTPPRFGLLSVAEIVADTDMHWQNGVEYVPNPVPAGHTSGVDCTPVDLDPQDDPMEVVQDGPFRVWTNYSALHPGLTEDEIHARARLGLSVSEGNLVERTVWPTLVGADTETPAGTTGGTLAATVGALEGWLYSNYGGTGVLHVQRSLIPALGKDSLVREQNGRLVTVLGTPVAAGDYPATGPDGAAAAAGSSWIAASGAVQVRRSPVFVPGEDGHGYFDHRTNQVIGHAERVYVVGWERVQAAALVTMEV